MRSLQRTVLLATATLAFFGLSGLSPASVDSVGTIEFHDEENTVPVPVVGDHLFVSSEDGQGASNACLTADRVMQNFALDIENVGGNIVLMTEGMEQDFADSWRSLAALDPVEVSLVIAHVIPDSGGDPIVDVVEIDGSGCALSRTLLTADDWMSLLDLARSIEV